MQIFYTNKDPFEAPLGLDDKRLRKMVLETAQILSTVASLWGTKTTYRKTHTHHPCVKWCADSRDNYLWLYKYFDAICNEYEWRFGKVHKSSELQEELYNAWAYQLPFGKFTTPPAVMAPHLMHKNNVVKSYWNLLNEKWDNDDNPTWTKRQPPLWRKV